MLARECLGDGRSHCKGRPMRWQCNDSVMATQLHDDGNTNANTGVTTSLSRSFSVAVSYSGTISRQCCPTLQRTSFVCYVDKVANKSHDRMCAQTCQRQDRRSKGYGMPEQIFYRMTCRLMHTTPCGCKDTQTPRPEVQRVRSPFNSNQLPACNHNRARNARTPSCHAN